MKYVYLVFAFILCFVSNGFSQVVYDNETAETSLFFQYFGSSLEPQKTTVIDNPDKSGINTSDKVSHYIKAAGAQTWAGGVSNPNPVERFDATDGGTVCIKVWMDHVGNVALKLEGDAGGGQNWITKQDYTTPNQWQELCFDLTVPSLEDANEPATGKSFAAVVVFFDFQIAGAATDVNYYFDDITPPGEAVITTTTILDFETAATTGEFSYFGSGLEGQKTLVIANPNPTGANTSATVGSFTKPAVAMSWAGANSNPTIPIDATANQQICIKVHMDHIGNLALKLEGSTSGAGNWIGKVSNTKINEWEEICFDLKSPAIEDPKVPATGVYQTVVLFFDFGIEGTGTDVLYYFDDLVTKGGLVAEDKDISFKVNMNNYTSSFDKVYVSGSFNNWSGDANPLTDADEDGIWEGTITLPNGVYEYKITLDNTAGKEETFLGTEECTKTTGTFTNRVLLVSADAALPEFCYNSCYACNEEIFIDFRLGMGTFTPSPEGVWLAGGGNFEIPGGKYKMKDDDGDKVYELRVPRKKGFSSYFIFANGNCPDYICQEKLEGQPCANPGNYNNRFIGPVNVNTVYASCFQVCSDNIECTSSANNFEVTNDMFVIHGNPSPNGNITLEFSEILSSGDRWTIQNNLGQVMYSGNLPAGQTTTVLDVNGLTSGIYFISAVKNNTIQSSKFIKL